MTDDVERVARAIYEENNRGASDCWDWDSSGLDAEYPGDREHYLRYAQAALTAMPQPGVRAGLERAAEIRRDALVSAYVAGATAVHENWREDKNPDFYEAASDYADAEIAKLPDTPDETAALRVFTLGAGKCVVTTGAYYDQQAVFIEPLLEGEPGMYGEDVPPEFQTERTKLRPGAVVLVIGGPLDVFLDAVNKAARDAALASGAKGEG